MVLSPQKATSWRTVTPEQTIAVGRECAGAWNQPTVVGLIGDLGAGKTTFLRGVVEARGGARSRVRSPTYTLINEYPDTNPRVVHADLYRVAGAEAQASVGLEDFFRDVLLLVEWADHWTGSWPESAVTVVFQHCGQHDRALQYFPRPPDQQG